MREVPVSAMAMQSPSSQRGSASPATETLFTCSCQKPSSGLCTGTHARSEAILQRLPGDRQRHRDVEVVT